MPRYRLRDIFVVMFVIAVLLAVLLPRIQRLREDSRRASCANNLKNLGLAIHNYHSAYRQSPSAMAGTAANEYRLSGLVALTPFLGEIPLWEEISNPFTAGALQFPAMGPSPTNQSYPPWSKQIWLLQCPTDAKLDRVSNPGFANTSYTFCIGDSVSNIHLSKSKNQSRGMFSPRGVITFRDVIDGLSHTIMAAEIGNARGRHKQGQFTVNSPPAILNRPIDCIKTLDPKSPKFYLADETLSALGRGGNWADGAAGHSLVNTILPPNSPSCGVTVTPTDGLFSAASYHPGGCHILMGDGAVRLISNTIDTGDLTVSPPTTVEDDQGNPINSPYGVWGAVGTRASTERFDGF